MGMTLRCRKSRHTLDLSSGGFMRLRRTVSDRIGEPWSSHYRTLTDGSRNKDDAWFQDFDRKTVEMIEKKSISIKVVDSLLQSDIKGAIRYGACKQILKIIDGYDDNFIYGYAALPNQPKFKDFKDLLQECVDLKSDLVWDN